MPARTLGARTALWAGFVVVAVLLAGCDKDDPAGSTVAVEGDSEQQPSTTTEANGSALANESALAGQLAAARLQIASLQGQNQQLNSQVGSLENELAEAQSRLRGDCSGECYTLSLTGRWQFGPHGHDCVDPISGKAYCHCSHEQDNVTACAEVQPPGARRLRSRGRSSAQQLELESAEGAEILGPAGAMRGRALATAMPAPLAARLPARKRGHQREQLAATAQAATAHAFTEPPRRRRLPAAGGVEAPRRLGSPAETIETYCNSTGLMTMHGAGISLQSVDELGEDPSALNQLESSILADVAAEMEDNNVDQMARDVFSFYICVRWVPDAIFWKLAKQEMATDLLSPVSDGENLNQAVSELYQNYKFVPLLCSQNLNVFSETDDEDNTYFRRFHKDVTALSQWLSDHSVDDVATNLAKADEIFCGQGTPMNDASCLAGHAFSNWAGGSSSWAGSLFGSFGWDTASEEDKWKEMATVFQSFNAQDGDGDAFHTTVAEWKSKFPFHSFVHKQGGMPSSGAPGPTERFLVCFGKRVASQLHRRPAGQHIMADQNNVGCHGFWDTQSVSTMLQRMVDLWRPPTCQLAEMTYLMKKQILKMYAQMNERLFDALPTMLMDEELSRQGTLDTSVAGPPPFDPQTIDDSSGKFVDGMRVRANQGMTYPNPCNTCADVSSCAGSWWEWVAGDGTTPDCLHVSVGEYGTVKVAGGSLAVVWDSSEEKEIELAESSCGDTACSGSALTVVPKDYGTSPTLASRASDLVAGVSSIIDYGKKMFGDMFRDQYTSLAELMSNSTSKWAVCPISGDANYTLLDTQLGVEDAAFRDFQMEAYASWTGYTAQVPGELCSTPDFFSVDPAYPGGKTCEISELHADHIEKYTMGDGSLEQFLCPVKTALGASEQLTVLKEKHTDHGQCLLHMTAEQIQHYQWPYNGGHMARRQFERKPNVPKVEYELIKLEHVPKSGAVSYARACSPDEKVQSPRFCSPIQLHAQWPSLQGMADALAEAASGSTGLGASAITSGISAYQQTVAQETWSDAAAASATYLGESIWDSLTGAGRLMHSLGESAVSALSDGVPGGEARDRRIEAEMFQDNEAGLLLHSLSFQRSIGNNGLTSNAKERYQRYVMTMPCPDFNPAVEFAVRKKWTSVALRIIQERSATRSHAESLLSGPSVQIAVRGEGRFFLKENHQAADQTWFEYGAAIKTLTETTDAQVTCEWSTWNQQCEPVDHCTLVGGYWTGDCAATVSTTTAGWATVSDGQLAKVFAPSVSSGSHPVTALKGLVATFYCGPKSAFTEEKVEPTTQPSSLKACLEAGIKTNAELHARSPWKLYFSEEVVAMAVFAELSPRQCSEGLAGNVSELLCGAGAQQAAQLDAHLSDGQKDSTAGTYQGLATGGGFPDSTPHEVWLRPEDALEAAGLLARRVS